MSQKQIEDIYDRLGELTGSVIALKTTMDLVIRIACWGIGAGGAILLAVFVWWLGKH